MGRPKGSKNKNTVAKDNKGPARGFLCIVHYEIG